MAASKAAPASSLLDLLFDEPAVGRCLVGPDGRVLRANAEWLRCTGSDGTLGVDLAGLLQATRAGSPPAGAVASPSQRADVPRHARIVDGRETWFEGAIDPVSTAEGAALLLTLREVSPGRRDRAGATAPGQPTSRLDSLAVIREIADHAPAAVFVKDAAGRYLFVNRWFLELLGLRTDEMVGRTVEDVLPTVARRVEEHDRRVAAGQEVASEDTIPTTRGPRVLRVVRFPFRLGGRTAGTFGIAVDVTERRRAEAALRETEERFRLLTQAMPQIVCVLRPDGTPEYVNGHWVAFSGLDLEATARVSWLGVVHPDDVPAAFECRRRALKLLAPQDVELRYRAADGTYRWFLSRLAPVVEGGRAVRLVGAGMEIEDRKRVEHVLRDADRRKDEFLGMLSHELRNPLAPIRNAIYVLRHAEGGEEAGRAKDVIERQTEHLTRLVDDLLDVTRIARGKIELRRDPVDLRELVRRTAEDLRSVVEGGGVSFRLELPGEEVWTSADATRLAQVVGNLLNNAAKFTRPGDEVTLSLRGGGGGAEIEVTDTGAGIEASLLPHVFEPFVQADRSLARTQGGLGLGLAFVKGIVELHGGTVRADSAGKGEGTRIALRLPLVGAAGPEARPVEPGPGTARRRVLVVDDNRDAADSLAQIVALLGHAAEVVYDGPTAITRAREQLPDVVLCDIGLPGMDGYEVARRIRASSSNHVRLVAVTGYAQPEDVVRAREAGFDGHVAKPPDPAKIVKALE